MNLNKILTTENIFVDVGSFMRGIEKVKGIEDVCSNKVLDADCLYRRMEKSDLSDNNFSTIFMFLCSCQEFELVKEVFHKKDIDINQKNCYGWTALIFAIYSNSIDLVKFLIKNGADVNVVSTLKETPLSIALQEKNFDIAKVLIENGADLYQDIKVKFFLGEINEDILVDGSYLTLAIESESIEMVQLFVQNGVGINTLKNPEELLAETSSLDIAKFLIEQGIKAINIETSSLDVAKFLIEYGATIGRDTILHKALLIPNLVFFKYFMELGASLDGVNGLGTPIWDDFQGTLLMKIILESNVSASYSKNININEKVLKENNIEIAKLLFENANLDIQNHVGNTALIISILENKEDFFNRLLEKEVNLNIENNHGDTALMIAFCVGNVKMIDALIEKGAKLEIENNKGVNVLHIARYVRYKYFNKLFKKVNINYVHKDISIDNIESVLDQYIDDRVPMLIKKVKQEELELKSKKKREAYYSSGHGFFYFQQIFPSTFNWSTEYKNFTLKDYQYQYDKLNIKEVKDIKELSFKEIVQKINNVSVSSNRDGEKSIKTDYPFTSYTIFNEISQKEVHYINGKGETFLMMASKVGNKELVEALLEIGADCLIEDNNGDTAETYARYSENPKEIIQLLRKYEKQGNIHNPRQLSELLNRFSLDKKLKYSNHTWDSSLNYNDFIKDLREGFSEIKDDLKILSSDLCQDIDSFLFDKNGIGWSSKVIEKELKKGTLPHSISFDMTYQPFKTFGDAIDNFKSLFVVKQNDKKLKLLKKFTKIKKELGLKSIDLSDLKKDKIDKFFTDTKRFEKALTLILKDIQENSFDDKKDIIVEANTIVENGNDMVEIKIIHIGSTSPKTADALKETIEKNGGNFQTIYSNLRSVCDWSIDTICQDKKRYRIDYLYPEIDNTKPHCTQIDDESRGFTHILRFYI